MCSSRVARALIAVALAAGPAAGQPTPVEPAPSEPAPPVEPAPVEPAAPVEPVPVESAPVEPNLAPPPIADPAPPPAPVPPAPTPPPSPRARRGPVFGLEVGVGAAPMSEGMFGPGFGKAFMIGYRLDRWTFEFRFGESYDLPATSDRLVDAGARGPLRIGSAGFRRLLIVGPVLPELLIGGARLERPLLVGSDVVRQFGVGAMLGGALTVPIAGGLLATAELRTYLVRWENPPGPVSTEPVDSGTGVTFTPTTDATSALPVTITAGVKILL